MEKSWHAAENFTLSAFAAARRTHQQISNVTIHLFLGDTQTLPLCAKVSRLRLASPFFPIGLRCKTGLFSCKRQPQKKYQWVSKSVLEPGVRIRSQEDAGWATDANGGEPLWNAPGLSRDILSGARKAKDGVKQAAPGNYRKRCLALGSVLRLLIR